MGLFPECGSERIEKCFSQTSQTLSNSVPISISSVEGFYSLGLVSLITAEAHFALFCFYLRQNLYSHLKIFISRKPFFIVIIQSDSGPHGCSGLLIPLRSWSTEYSARKLESFRTDHMHMIVSLIYLFIYFWLLIHIKNSLMAIIGSIYWEFTTDQSLHQAFYIYYHII